MRVLIAMDKFRGTLSAGDAVRAAAQGVLAAAPTADCRLIPLADGGEGTLEVLGGANRTTQVRGPLGAGVLASWRLDRRTAVIEMAQASGLELAGGSENNNPLDATTTGTGELIAAAVSAGATRIIVTLGGSATTDGGLGAIEALRPVERLKPIEIVAACDVETLFRDAAEVFAPQKGASPAQVKFLTRRLDLLAARYRNEFGVDLSALVGGGAAGGLGGGLAAVGARLSSGFDIVAEEVDLADALSHTDLVITGEGLIDPASFQGKVVGGIHERATTPVITLVGDILAGFEAPLSVASLVQRFGRDRALDDAANCLRELAAEAVGDYLAS